MRTVILLPLAALLLSAACTDFDVKTPGGTVPKAYLADAGTLTGDYVGEFNRARSVLTVSLEGDKPAIDYDGQAGRDMVGVLCESSIGSLQSIAVVSRRNGQVNVLDATFGFDPNHCAATAGRELKLRFTRNPDGSTSVAASIAGTERGKEYLGSFRKD